MNQASNLKLKIVYFFMERKAVLIALLLGIILSISSPIFLSATNLLNVLRQVCTSAILALGFTLVLGSGHMDLSIGSTLGLTGLVMAKLMAEANCPIIVAIFAGILVGATCGALNAFLITAFDLPPFIVTFATQSLYRGIIYIWTNMLPVSGLPDRFIFLGQGYLGQIPAPVFLMIFMVIVIWILANKTLFGRYVVARGGNPEAAKSCGISLKMICYAVYMLAGICAAIAAVVMTARSASAQVSAGLNMEMDAIAAVVIGGTALSGGIVNVIGTLFGCLIVGMVNNGLTLLGVNINFLIIAKGLMILIALMLDRLSSRIYSDIEHKQMMRE